MIFRHNGIEIKQRISMSRPMIDSEIEGRLEIKGDYLKHQFCVELDEVSANKTKDALSSLGYNANVIKTFDGFLVYVDVPTELRLSHLLEENKQLKKHLEDKKDANA